MKTILVTAINESTGKTAVALALGRHAQEQGYSVGFMKPKGTRLQSRVGKTLDADPLLAQEVLGIEADITDLEPIVYSPTFIESAIRGHEDPAELRGRVKEAYDTLAAPHDLMLIEGGGTLTTGGIVELTDADVAGLLSAQVLLVVEYRDPRDVDDVLAAVEQVGDHLLGVLFNAVPDTARDSLESDVVPFFERRGIPVVGVLPRTKDLAGVTVAELADELAAEVLTEVPTDAYVERFVVGAMGSEAALQYFRRTKDAAVITGGDRSEIHTVALEAPGVKCLILTGGYRPSGAVLGAAHDRGVPVLFVQSDTRSTIERAEDVIRSGRTRDEHTVHRVLELLTQHADLPRILDMDDAASTNG